MSFCIVSVMPVNHIPKRSIEPSNAGILIDLFSGAGGLTLGAARAGFNVAIAVDTDAKANDTHRRNFPCALHLNDDVTQLPAVTLKDSLPIGCTRPAGIVGGPPCQGFSIMGKRDTKDLRNGAFGAFFRIVSELEPAFFLAENVPGILHSQYDSIRDAAFSQLHGRYVLLPPLSLTASDYGAATKRTRVFFFGYCPDRIRPLTMDDFKAPAKTVVPVRVSHALEGLPSDIDPDWQTEAQGWQTVSEYPDTPFSNRLWAHIPPDTGDQESLQRHARNREVSGCLGTRHSDAVLDRYRRTECGRTDPVSRAYRLHPDGFCPTLRAGTGPDRGSHQALRPIHPELPRVITPREAARLQGFPDWFRFQPTKWHSFRQIGNSVSPILAERLLSVVAGAMDLQPPQ